MDGKKNNSRLTRLPTAWLSPLLSRYCITASVNAPGPVVSIISKYSESLPRNQHFFFLVALLWKTILKKKLKLMDSIEQMSSEGLRLLVAHK
jgi:hypothetical protein